MGKFGTVLENGIQFAHRHRLRYLIRKHMQLNEQATRVQFQQLWKQISNFKFQKLWKNQRVETKKTQVTN